MVRDIAELPRLIGRRVRYRDDDYEITDLLPEEGLMILSSVDGVCDVQDDSFGRAHRLVPKRQNLKFCDSDGRPTSVWEELTFLDGPMK